MSNPCDPCAEIIAAEPLTTNDIHYVGPDDACLGITKPALLTTVLDKIRAFISNRLFGVISQSLKVTYPTTASCNKMAIVELVPSAQAGNALVISQEDGLPYVGGIDETGGTVTDVIIGNSSCITFTKTVVNGVITFTPNIDYNCLAAIICPICNPTCPSPNSLTIS